MKLVEAEMQALGIKHARDAIKIAIDKRKDLAFRERACFVLGQLKPPGSAHALLRVVQSESDERINWVAFSALGLIGDRRVTIPLLKMLKNSKDESRRQHITHALWFVADPRVRSVLTSLLSDKDEDDTTRGFAAEGLGHQRQTLRSLKALVSALEDPSVNVRISALCGLSAARYLARTGTIRRFFHQKAIPAIRARLRDRAAIKGEGTVASFAKFILSS